MDRRKLTIAGAVIAASLTCAAPAMASTPVTLTFNHAVLDTPGTGDAQIVTPSGQPLKFIADVNSNGTFTVQPADFSAPAFTTTSPVAASASVTLASPASGRASSSGALTMTADFLATITVGSYGSCAINTGNVTLSTATTKPLPGQIFAGANFTAGTGAFGASWNSLPGGSGSICPDIDSFLDGPGGIWISRGISLAQAETPDIAVKATAPTEVIAGRVATVVVTFTNTGASDTKSVKVCLTAAKPLTTSACHTVIKPKAGFTKKLAFRVMTTGATAGTHLLTLTATGTTRQTVALKVTG